VLDRPGNALIVAAMKEPNPGPTPPKPEMPKPESPKPEMPKPEPAEPEMPAPTEPEPSDSKAGQKAKKFGGPAGPEPTRYGDWERNGRASDF